MSIKKKIPKQQKSEISEPQNIKKEVLREEKKLTQKKCITCSKPAEFCMRGLPDSTYCKECAKDYFKLLSYLDKLK